MSNSINADHILLSPNHSGHRKTDMYIITPHVAVGYLTSLRIAELFQPKSRKASCNLSIGKNGDRTIVVDEDNASWCSSSSWNDQRAYTIECASDTKAPFALTDATYESLITSIVDIMKAHGKNKLLWINIKNKALAYKPASNEMILTAHRWYANKACPGDWLYNRFGQLAEEVNKRLVGETTAKVEKQVDIQIQSSINNKVTAKGIAKKYSKYCAGTYKTTANLYCRDDAGTTKKAICKIPKNTKVRCYGYYSSVGNVNWYYIQFVLDGVQYTGFSSGKYLARI